MILYSMIHKYHLVSDYRVATLHNGPAYFVNSVFTDALSHSLQFRLPYLGTSAKSKGARDKDREIEQMQKVGITHLRMICVL